MNTEESSDNDPQTGILKKVFRRLFNGSEGNVDSLREILDECQKNGEISKDVADIVNASLSADNKKVRDIMIPRTQIVSISEKDSNDDVISKISKSTHSRFPVFDKDNEDVIGVLLAKDVLKQLYSGKKKFLDVVLPPTYIPESKRLYVLLNDFREKRQHMAVVIDEYGKPVGLITIEDVLEEIVGEIEDEHDPAKTEQIINVSHNTWLVDGMVSVEEFNKYFQTSFDEDAVDTISGILLLEFNCIPKVNDQIEIESFNFRIVKGDPRRIHTVQVSKT